MGDILNLKNTVGDLTEVNLGDGIGSPDVLEHDTSDGSIGSPN